MTIGATFTPPDGELWLEGGFFTTPFSRATIESINVYAGSAIGSAVCVFSTKLAKDAEPEMGKRAHLKIGGRMVLRGVAAEAPAQIDPKTDEYTLTIFCDKWLMASRTVGQMGIGTEGSPAGADGFRDVGFQVIFNKDGAGNKEPGGLNFNTGSTAVPWTFKNILEFLFTYYVAADVAAITVGDLSAAYELVPSHLELTGMTALQAIDTVVQAAGESWGLIYMDPASRFVSVRPGAGTLRTVDLFAPFGGADAGDATEFHAQSARIGRSIVDCRDTFQAVSAPTVIEHTYRNFGAYPLLVRDAGFADKEYACRYRVDVTKYAAHSLGPALSSGSRPKPWLSDLVTRTNADGSAYVAKADIEAAEFLKLAQPVSEPVLWISVSGDDADLKLCTGGYRIDYEHGTVDLKSTIELMTDSGAQDTVVSSWTLVQIRLTVATVIGLPEYKQTSAGASYLPTPFVQVIAKADAVPQYRYESELPDLTSSDPNDRTTVGAGAVEKYIPVDDVLTDAITAALAACNAMAVDVRLGFEFIPLVNIGDRLQVTGRSLGLTGNEVVRAVNYNVHHAYQTFVEASNVTTAIDPDKLMYTEVG